MITLEHLAGLKYVQPDNFGEEVTTLGALDNAIEQGSQGWGVSPSVAVHLHLARDLKAALLVAKDAQKLRNELKGKQLELGRCKAQLKAVKTKLGDMNVALLQAKATQTSSIT